MWGRIYKAEEDSTRMAKVTKGEIYELARMSGIELDDDRGSAVLARLNGLIEELDKISVDSTLDVGPPSIFVVDEEQANDKI